MKANETGVFKPTPAENYICGEVKKDLASGRFKHIRTRFAPEPNAYIHIGSAFSIILSYGIAEQFGGEYTLRFDDTNPAREKVEYIESIKEDMRWLGYDWENTEYNASDYFSAGYVEKDKGAASRGVRHKEVLRLRSIFLRTILQSTLSNLIGTWPDRLAPGLVPRCPNKSTSMRTPVPSLPK